MDRFFEHLADPAPGFRCYRPGSSADSLEHSVGVRHDLAEPADPADLTRLEALVPDPTGHLRRLYEAHDGMILYTDGISAGIRFFPIREIEQKNEEWRDWFDFIDEDELHAYQLHGRAFGEVEASGNYFVLWEGRVYYSSHDDSWEEPVGADVSAFLARVASEPATFLEEAGCYTRFGEEQWIPGQYVPDLGT